MRLSAVPMLTNLFVAEIAATRTVERRTHTLVFLDMGVEHFARDPACRVAQKAYTEWVAILIHPAVVPFCKRLTRIIFINP
jgi:hypothetical protein